MDGLKYRADILLCSCSAVDGCPQMSGITPSDVGHNALRCRANILLCSCSAVMLMMSSDVGLTYYCAHVNPSW